MGRRRREHRPGAVYHACSRGNNGKTIFRDDDDRSFFLAILADVCLKTKTRILAYCLMGNHFHVLLEIALASLEAVMRRVLCRYSRGTNRKYKRFGHLFQARYKSKLCRGDRYYRKLLPYIHRNPVKAGMVATPEDWRWSSAHQFEGPIRSTLVDVERALSYLAADTETARHTYSDGMASADDGFEPKYDTRQYFCWRENPAPRPAKTLESLAHLIEREFEVCLRAAKRGRSQKNVGRGRRAFALQALAEGHRGSAIAAFLGISRSAVSHALSG